MSDGDRLLAASALANAALLAHTVANLRLLRRPPACGAGPLPAVSVLVPARDEATRIRPCVQALLEQEGVDFELLVLDDRSTDGTAEVVRTAGRGDPRLRVLDGRPLPSGWLGKPHACAQLAAAAHGGVLVFVDADVVLDPGGLAATVRLLSSSGLGAVCPYPRQLADGLGPRLVQPLLQWSWLTFLPLRRAEHGRPSLTAANGQLLAVTARAYGAAGGHGAVRAEVIEDIALARAVKRAGYGAAVADGSAVASCRMYGDWAQLRAGYTKSLWAAFGSRPAATAVATMLAVLYLLPPLAAVADLVARRRLRPAALSGYAAAVGGRVLAARATRGRVADAPAHPASVAALLWLLASSWRARAAGTLSWKGRALHG
jgi:hypothetical protein